MTDDNTPNASSNQPNPPETGQPKLFVKTFPAGPLQCNCTIIGDPVTGDAIVIDPGGDSEKIMRIIQEQGLRVRQIIHTHAHFDHFLAAGALHEQTGAPLCLHKEDAFLWRNLEMQCTMFGIPYAPTPEPQHWLAHEEELPVAQYAGKALFTPGHTPGSMSFLFEEAGLLIAGDTLFRGSIGRTDLWGGDFNTIQQSIRQQLFTLDENLTVITGHGPATSIGYELRNNPFVTA